MTVANLHCQVAALQIDRQNPVAIVDLKFVANQILGVADDDSIVRRIDVDYIARAGRTTRQPFALTNGKEFDSVVLTQEISLDIVNLAAVEFVFPKMGS